MLDTVLAFVRRRKFGLSVAGTVLGFSLVITFAIIGGLSLLERTPERIGSRLPLYVLVAAVIFTALIFLLERRLRAPERIFLTSLVMAVVGFVLCSLGVEGVLYAVENPEVALSNVVFYFFAAGVMSTGVIYWAVKHWRELLTANPEAGL